MNFEERVQAKRAVVALEVAKQNIALQVPKIPPVAEETTRRVLDLVDRLQIETTFVRVFGTPSAKVEDVNLTDITMRRISFSSENADQMLGIVYDDGDASMDMNFQIKVLHAETDIRIIVESDNEINGNKSRVFACNQIDDALNYLEDEVADFCANVIEQVEPSPSPGP